MLTQVFEFVLEARHGIHNRVKQVNEVGVLRERCFDFVEEVLALVGQPVELLHLAAHPAQADAGRVRILAEGVGENRVRLRVLPDCHVRLHEQDAPVLTALLLLHALLSGGDGFGILTGEEKFPRVLQVIRASWQREPAEQRNEEENRHASSDGDRESALQDLAGQQHKLALAQDYGGER